MTQKDMAHIDPRFLDFRDFSAGQWAAICFYRDARRHQRKLQIGALLLAFVVAGVTAISSSFGVTIQSDAAFLDSPWFRDGVPALILIVALMALSLSFGIVTRAKSYMREWKLPTHLIEGLEQCPTEKM
ncbi:hypothetical protein [Candidatus Burkholderia verschuerenii]|uniref:hypothetical protein n=1 Tax=Candidatus Burkholderia verschuerenii TaxID=242163 RepID=UPI00067E4074|nr:hypothetical protein [Candidatus Burkholderia verschuerenii]